MKRKKIFILLICGLHLLPLILIGAENKISIMTSGSVELDGAISTSHSPENDPTNNGGAKGVDNGGGILTEVLRILDASGSSFLPNNADESGIEIGIGSGNSGSFQLPLNREEISRKNFPGGLSYASNFPALSEDIKALTNFVPDAGISIDAIHKYAYREGIMNSSTVPYQIDRFLGQLEIGSIQNPDFGIMCLDPTLSIQVVLSCLEQKHITEGDALNLMRAAAEGFIEKVRTMSCPVCVVLFHDNAVANAPVFEQSNNPTFSMIDTQVMAGVLTETFNSAIKLYSTSPLKDTSVIEVGKTVEDLNKDRSKDDQMTNASLYQSGSTASTYQADASQSKCAYINPNTRSCKYNQAHAENIAHLISEQLAARGVHEEHDRIRGGRRRRR